VTGGVEVLIEEPLSQAVAGIGEERIDTTPSATS